MSKHEDMSPIKNIHPKRTHEKILEWLNNKSAVLSQGGTP